MMRKILLAIGGGICIAMLSLKAYFWLRPAIAGMSSQEALWAFYRWAGWWWWGSAIVLSVMGLALLLTLSPPRNNSMIVTRLFLFAGFMMHCASWGNNALGPLAYMLVLIGTVLILWQVSAYDVTQRRANPIEHPSVAHRLLWFLTRDNSFIRR